MNRTMLLATSALITFHTSTFGADLGTNLSTPRHRMDHSKYPRTKLLYGQNSNYSGEGISSMNFTSTGTAYDDQAADDFVVPTGAVWRITEIDVSGAYYNGPGPATSENVYFYKNALGKPGKEITGGAFTGLSGTDDHGRFAITLPNRGLRLRAGHYWVSVVANMFAGSAGEWGWNINGAEHQKLGMWQNPGGADYICPSWNTIEFCAGIGPDLMFQLRGASKSRNDTSEAKGGGL